MNSIVYPGRGVYSGQDLRSAIAAGRIETLSGFNPKHVGSASIDLTVTGEEMYHVERMFRPMAQRHESVRDVLKLMRPRPIKTGDELIPGHEYLMKATVNANFPPGMYAYKNAKSTSGRNFLMVRTITDRHGWFDTLDKRNQGFTGEVWLSVQPLGYGVHLTQDECYNQMRVFDGDTRLKNDDLNQLLAKQDLFFRRDGTPYKQSELSLFSNDGTLFCTLHAPGKKLVGFRLKRTKKVLDLTARNVDPSDFWEPLYAEEAIPGDPESGFVHLRAGDMYLLSTHEMFKVPDNMCAELRALDPRLGMFFSHFAGFFDNGFFGTATLEVLAPFDMVLRHGDPVARFELELLRSAADSYAITGNYQAQVNTNLAKQFAVNDEWIRAMA
jgi:deoxycytidine triphosphate deaminase